MTLRMPNLTLTNPHNVNRIRKFKLKSVIIDSLVYIVFACIDRRGIFIRDVPDIHPVPGKCRISHYSLLPGPGKIMGPSNKKKIFFYFFLPEVLMIPQ